MAQTKRKRQTKHRGNAAGIVETRGRTGRKPTRRASEARKQARQRARATATTSRRRGAARLNRAVIAMVSSSRS